MSELRISSINRLEKTIRLIYGEATRLTREELDKFNRKEYNIGWKIHLTTAGQVIPAAILIKHNYPFSAPHYFLVQPEPYLYKIPHLDESGYLCLEQNPPELSSPTPTLLALHRSANILFEHALAGRLEDDFRNEFLSYWHMHAQGGASACVTPTILWKNIVFCQIGDRVFFFDDYSIAEKWIRSRYSDQKKISVNIFNTILLPQGQMWTPSEYPKSGLDILSHARNVDSDAVHQIMKHAASTQLKYLPVLFQFKPEQEHIFIGIKVYEPRISKGPYKTLKLKKPSPKSHRDTTNIYGHKFFSSSAILENLSIQRIDATWLHKRGEAGRNSNLAEMTIAILGCGSIGAHVADVLARAGVGTILLYDMDNLSWDNIYRHILPPECIGKNKATALKNYLAKKFPNINIEAFPVSWEEHYAQEQGNVLKKVDLILSLIGHTTDQSEIFLGYLTYAEQNFPPILYGWTEPWGAAGHALLIGDGEHYGCLKCVTQSGSQVRNVFRFNTRQSVMLPACSISYAPYGFVDILPTVSMISSLAIEFLTKASVKNNYLIWIANVGNILDHGGELCEWITTEYGKIDGEEILRRTWSHDKSCRVCNEKYI